MTIYSPLMGLAILLWQFITAPDWLGPAQIVARLVAVLMEARCIFVPAGRHKLMKIFSGSRLVDRRKSDQG